jgi:hypothetical protein
MITITDRLKIDLIKSISKNKCEIRYSIAKIVTSILKGLGYTCSIHLVSLEYQYNDTNGMM